jgi:hypothetical protein
MHRENGEGGHKGRSTLPTHVSGLVSSRAGSFDRSGVREQGGLLQGGSTQEMSRHCTTPSRGHQRTRQCMRA